MSRLLRAAIVCWTLAAGIAFAAWADPLDEYRRQHRDGTLFPHAQQLDDWRSNTTDREIEFAVLRQDDSRIWARFVERAVYRGAPAQVHGVMMITHDGEQPKTAEWVLFEGQPLPLAAATGQALDVGTTAYALSTGNFVELNPMGWLVVPIKAAGYAALKTLGLRECAEAMVIYGKAGWAASGWNAGLMVGGPVLGVVGAVAAAVFMVSEQDAAIECASG